VSKYTEYLKYEFSESEINDAAKDLARAAQTKAALEQRKKEIDAQMKADIEAQNSIVGRLAQLINVGHEYRDVECRIELDTPEPGRKRIIRLDTGEEVKVVAMTDTDKQLSLDLHAKAETESSKKEPIVTPAPEIRCIEAGVIDSGRADDGDACIIIMGTEEPASAALAPAAVMGGTHQRRTRKGE
jgi:hypothetical protein